MGVSFYGLAAGRRSRRGGGHVPGITYVVSESFVVATKRVKHAIKVRPGAAGGVGSLAGAPPK